ncbi:MAG: hypothetical protein ACFFB3_10175 [Candidatus Hodarchaeota archaeon]
MSITIVMLGWILLEPSQPSNIFTIVILIVVYAEVFVGLGFFLVNSFLLAMVAFGGEELSKYEKKWLRFHLVKHISFTVAWAALVMFTITASSDYRVSIIVNTIAIAILFIYGNFYRDIDKAPSHLRKAVT